MKAHIPVAGLVAQQELLEGSVAVVFEPHWSAPHLVSVPQTVVIAVVQLVLQVLFAVEVLHMVDWLEE